MSEHDLTNKNNTTNRDTNIVLGVVLSIFIIRSIWLAIGAVGIVGDEAYYWDWSRRPALGYFSKPPGISWLHYILGNLTNNSAIAIKVCAAGLVTGSILFFYYSLRKIDPFVAKWTTLLVCVMPGQLLLGSFLTIDAPLMFFWSMAFYLTISIIYDNKKPSVSTWILLFIAIGCGHLFKQMMLVAVPLIIVTVAFFRRERLKSPGLWLSTLGSFLFLAPTLYWNIQNEWITVEHTAHHFQKASTPYEKYIAKHGETMGHIIGYLDKFIGRLGGTLAVLAGVIFSPILFGLVFTKGFKALKTISKLKKDQKIFLIWGTIPLFTMLCLTVRQQVNPNWPAVFLLPAIALASSMLLTGKTQITKLWKSTMIVSASFTLLFMVAAFTMEMILPKVGAKIPKRAWFGHKGVSKKVQKLRDDRPELSELKIAAVGHRFAASQLAFHLDGNPKTYHWPYTAHKVKSQYDLWPGVPTGEDLLLVVERKNKDHLNKFNGGLSHIKRRFDSMELLETIDFHPQQEYPRFQVYLATNLSSWPHDDPKRKKPKTSNKKAKQNKAQKGIKANKSIK